MIERDIVLQARNADLLCYLNSNGYRLNKAGSGEYRLEEHDSLVISNNMWHWFSRDIGGNTLDFLMKYEGRSFSEAIGILTCKDFGEYPMKQREIFIRTQADDSKINDNKLILPAIAKDYHRVFAYLNKTRKIDRDIIADMMHKGKIYQSERCNCVFTGSDKDGNVRFACERGTISGVSYRRDCPGSDKRFCFSMEGRSNTLYAFEAPINALSHATIFKMQKLDYTEDNRLALGGVCDIALTQYLDDRPEVRNVILCLDNDLQGRSASERISKVLRNKGYMVSEEFSCNKDYNDDLIQLFTKRQAFERVI